MWSPVIPEAVIDTLKDKFLADARFEIASQTNPLKDSPYALLYEDLWIYQKNKGNSVEYTLYFSFGEYRYRMDYEFENNSPFMSPEAYMAIRSTLLTQQP